MDFLKVGQGLHSSSAFIAFVKSTTEKKNLGIYEKRLNEIDMFLLNNKLAGKQITINLLFSLL